MSDARTMEIWKIDGFLQKLKKVVRIVSYGLAISQSDCRKIGPHQLPYNNFPTMHEAFSCQDLYQQASALAQHISSYSTCTEKSLQCSLFHLKPWTISESFLDLSHAKATDEICGWDTTTK